ncbi:MAG: hypothetical protein PHP54_05660, partial [Clostridia bacterium]|nr:hypothetical protein [Clostridia bacterium]
AYEYVASVLNNGNSNIGTYMKVEHVQSNKVKTEYAKYYDVYEPGDEEKEGGTYYDQGGINLWNSGNAESQNIIRKRLTAATYANFASKKGDALWEISNGNSYYGKYTSGTGNWEWLQDTARDFASGSQCARGWNSDYMLVGHAYLPFLLRGSYFSYGYYAGVFAAGSHYGYGIVNLGFRPVLAVGFAL